jgi:dTDP-4-amino-4,6-dideoxygalactose transaminase
MNLRTRFLPYCLPLIGDEEIAEVADSMRSGWITTGPKAKRFEEEFAAFVGARHAIAVSSCTAALHLSLAALGIGPGDEVIVPTMTFCATANVVVHLGARPVLVDTDEQGLLDLNACEQALSSKTKAIVPVHYAGQTCDLDSLARLAAARGVPVVEDAAHAIGAEYRGARVGVHSRAVAFSFYATKTMTTGEGGMITTNDGGLAVLLRRLALHGMSRDAWKRYSEAGSWYYEVTEPGYKSNMTDIQASMGLHQLRKLENFIRRRRDLASLYGRGFGNLPEIRLPVELEGRRHCYHLYPVWLDTKALAMSRAEFIEELKERRIGASVHFIPLHRHPYYAQTYGYSPGDFPGAERMYEGLVSLPLYPSMTDEDAMDVVDAVLAIIERQRRRLWPCLADNSVLEEKTLC